MANSELIDNLNRALSLELAGVIQYHQHSFLVTGAEREVFRDFFRKQSKEAHEHTIMVGDKIVALGGVPTVEPAMIRQATSLGGVCTQPVGNKLSGKAHLPTILPQLCPPLISTYHAHG